ncbi:MAG TPA: hypothetical protein VJR29_01940 [bacterium]|nr:hypothetical protein [bacterium]
MTSPVNKPSTPSVERSALPESIDLKPIKDLYLENLNGAQGLLGHEMVADVFQGSDVSLTEDDKLKGLCSSDVVALDKEAETIQFIKKCDLDHDQKLDLDEFEHCTDALKEKFKGDLAPIRSEAFGSLAEVVQERWAPIAANMTKLKAKLLWKPTLDVLKTYSEGIPRSLKYQKTDETGAFVFYEHENRKKALEALKKVVAEGIEKREPWAMQGDFIGMLNRLDRADQVALHDIPLSEIHQILMLPDQKERAEKLYQLAIRERPQQDPYWGNLYFARSILAYLGNRSTTGDAGFDKRMTEKANQTREEILGEGGSWVNIISVGLTNVLCLGGLLCDPTPYRSPGDAPLEYNRFDANHDLDASPYPDVLASPDADSKRR